MRKYLFIVLGLITLTLGLLGIVTPGLPTTPFILLTAYLFARSSPHLHQKLLDNSLTGRYLKKVNKGFSWKGLCISIGIMWIMIGITAFIVFNYGTMRFIMLGLGVIGTMAQIIVLKKKKRKETEVVPIDLEANEYNKKKGQRLKAS